MKTATKLLAALLLALPCLMRAYVPLGLSWPDGDIRMELQLVDKAPGGPASSIKTYTQVAQEALNTWNGVLKTAKFTWTTDSSRTPVNGDQINSVFWSDKIYTEDFDTYTLGITLLWGDENHISDADVIFNTQAIKPWDSYSGMLRQNIDFRRVAMHEFGHALGLGHTDGGDFVTTPLMNSTISDTDSITADEIAGVDYLYGTKAAPTLSLQPLGGQASEYAQVSFSVKPLGRGPYRYQWKRDGKPLVDEEIDNYGESRPWGSGGPTLTIFGVHASDMGSYTLEVSNAYGTTSSSPAVLSMNKGFRLRPSSLEVRPGDPVTLKAELTGYGAVTYQWFNQDGPIKGATSSTYSIASMTAANEGSYYVDAYDGSEHRNTPSIRLRNSVGFTRQPESRNCAKGDSITLSTEVHGVPAFQNVQALLSQPDGSLIVLDGNLKRLRPGQDLSLLASLRGGNYLAMDGAGNFYTACRDGRNITRIATDGTVSHFAGLREQQNTPSDGWLDDAGFGLIRGLAADKDGNVYVTDQRGPCIRKVNSSGHVFTMAGSSEGVHGSTDGTYDKALFNDPTGLCIDEKGNLYTFENGLGVLRRITPDGTVSTLAGNPAYSGRSIDGVGSAAGFGNVRTLTVSKSGRVYVLEETQIRSIDTDGTVTTLAGNAHMGGTVDGPAHEALLSSTSSLALMDDGALVFTDGGLIPRKLSADGSTVSTLMNLGQTREACEGPMPSYQWYRNGSAISGATTLTLSIPSFDATVSGDYVLRVTKGDVTVNSATASLGFKLSITAQPQTQEVLQGQGAKLSVSVDNPSGRTLSYQWYHDFTKVEGATSPELSLPLVTTENSGMYVLQIYDGVERIESGYAFVTRTLFLDKPPEGGSYADGSRVLLRAEAQNSHAPNFPRPARIARDSKGTLYLAGESAGRILLIRPDGKSEQLALPPLGESRGHWVSDVVLDKQDNLYLCERMDHTIYKLTPSGELSLVAGSPLTPGAVNGKGAAALFNNPGCLAIDDSGRLYVGDMNLCVRRIDTDGTVTTIAGDLNDHPYSSYVDGPAAKARFTGIASLCVDKAGNVYVSDSYANTVRRIGTDGQVSSIGSAFQAGLRDGTADTALFSGPNQMAIAPDGSLWVSDYTNGRIRRVSSTGTVSTVCGNGPNWDLVQTGWSDTTNIGSPGALLFREDGSLLFSSGPNRVAVLAPNGAVSTLFGSIYENSWYSAGKGVTRYQWSLNGKPLPGAVNALLGIENLQAADVGEYSVAVTNDIGTLTFKATVEHQVGAPAITRQPSSQILHDGKPATLSIQCTGTDPRGYQWYRNGALLSGQQSATLSLPTARVADSGDYTVTVTNAFGEITSTKAQLMVVIPVVPSVDAFPATLAQAGGSKLTLSIRASGSDILHYTWYKDGVALANSDSADLVLANAMPKDSGSYTVLITNSAGSITSKPMVVTVTPPPHSRLSNISTRSLVNNDSDQAQIAGFVISGTEPKTVLIRASGPALAAFELPNTVSDPMIKLFRSGDTLPMASNDDWSRVSSEGDAIEAAAGSVGAFGWTRGSKDAALLIQLQPGVYTAMVTNANSGKGVALVEVYETEAGGSALSNLSTRSPVGTGSQMQIAGFVISGLQPKKVLIRAVGPTLAGFGLVGTLVNPTIDVVNQADGMVVASNDDWGSPDWSPISNANNALGAFAFQATNSRDAALLTSLPPGAYTVTVKDKDGGTGIALIEIYDADKLP
jgi:sugar lactone lactonase YvrE